MKDRVGGLVVELANARAEVDKLRAYQLSRLESDSYLERVKKERGNVVDQLNAIHVRMLNIFGFTPGIAWPSIFTSVEKAVNLSEKLDSVHRDLAKRLGLPSDTGWVDIMSAVERIVEDSQDHAEVRANNKGLGVKLATVEKERDALKEQLETAKGLPLQIADALDAPPGERSFLTDDGSLNTALVDRIIGYFKQLYTAAGYSEPPQGGWGEILTHIRKYTGFKPENPVEWPKYLKQNADNSKE